MTVPPSRFARPNPVTREIVYREQMLKALESIANSLQIIADKAKQGDKQ